MVPQHLLRLIKKGETVSTRFTHCMLMTSGCTVGTNGQRGEITPYMLLLIKYIQILTSTLIILHTFALEICIMQILFFHIWSAINKNMTWVTKWSEHFLMSVLFLTASIDFYFLHRFFFIVYTMDEKEVSLRFLHTKVFLDLALYKGENEVRDITDLKQLPCGWKQIIYFI